MRSRDERFDVENGQLKWTKWVSRKRGVDYSHNESEECSQSGRKRWSTRDAKKCGNRVENAEQTKEMAAGETGTWGERRYKNGWMSQSE